MINIENVLSTLATSRVVGPGEGLELLARSGAAPDLLLVETNLIFREPDLGRARALGLAHHTMPGWRNW